MVSLSFLYQFELGQQQRLAKLLTYSTVTDLAKFRG